MRKSTLRFPLLLAIPALAIAGCAPRSRDVEPSPAHRPLAEALEAAIREEMEDSALPGVSIALADGDKVVYARGFGWADPGDPAGEGRKVPADASTVYRVASISKLFTAAAAMSLVEEGKLDLDAPVSRYLEGFRPRNPSGVEPTLRHLLSHHSGLVREPPVGHYFDPTGPPLGPTVESLSATALVHAPGSRFKYSNAGVAAAGRVIESVAGRPFEEFVQERVLDPLGLEDASFTLSPGLEKRLARGFLWTYDGRVWEAPVFPLGLGPAGNLSATVLDLVRFAQGWFPEERGGRPLLRPETRRAMWTPQLSARGKETGIGLGFFIDRLDGKLLVEHGGAIYGYASELLLLPEEGLAVAVVTNVDFANACATRIARQALSLLLAVREGKPPPPPPARTAPLGVERARALAGRYGEGSSWIDLHERDGDLWLDPVSGLRFRIREREGRLVAHDRFHSGGTLEPVEGGVRWMGKVLRKMPDAEPPPAPERWLPLIGEYGWDHDVLYVLERGGKLGILIEWFAWYPLEERGDDVFILPDHGLYLGEEVRFRREGGGRPSAVLVGGVEFPRRRVGPEDGAVFRIQPLQPVEMLRESAAKARPPVEAGTFRAPDLVDLSTLDPGLRFDVRYAGRDNFLGTALYPIARVLLQRPAAEALLRAHRKLGERGYGLLIHDGYRPWKVTRMFWDGTPPHLRDFVADPAKGSRHNRGSAVDLTLHELSTGRAVEMPSVYDEFTPRAYPDYPGGTDLQRWRRRLLREAMEAEGFTVYPKEWWHFDHRDWKEYPILDVPLEG